MSRPAADPLAAAAAAQCALLEARLGRRLPPAPPAPDPVPAPSRLSARDRARLARATGDALLTDEAARLAAAFGGGLGEALRRRAGATESLPDAVALPADEPAVVRLLAAAAELGLGVRVRGAGTQDPLADAPQASSREGLLALSTRHLTGPPRLDAARGTVTVAGGVSLGAVERALRGRGFSLGADPATPPERSVGGWLAGAGFDVEGPPAPGTLVAARVATPEGVLFAEADGLGALLPGSAGRLGVVVEATLRARRRVGPESAWARTLPDLARALETLEGLCALEAPDLAAGVAEGAPAARPRRSWRRAPHPDARPALLTARLAGDRAARRRARRALRTALGRRPGAAGADASVAPSPALRAALLERGVGLGSVAVRVPWSALPGLRTRALRAVEAALEVHAGGGRVRLRARGPGPEARLALDLLYPVDPGHVLKPWLALREAAVAALVRAGARPVPAHAAEPAAAGLAGAAWRACAARLDPGAVLRRRERA